MEDEEVVQENVEPTPDVTESTPVEPDEAPASQPQEQEESVESPEAPKEKPRSAQGRIKELVAEKKKAQQEAQALREALENAANQPLPSEIDPNEYRALTFEAQQIKQKLAQMEQERVAEKLESESQGVYSKFPELSANKSLDEKLSKQWYEDYAEKDQEGNIVGYRKSPLKFVEEQMDLLNTAKTEITQKTVKAMERQVADSPVTPDISANKTPKDPKDMTTAELEAHLGIVNR